MGSSEETRTDEPAPTATLRLRRVLPVAAETLFGAFTDPAWMGEWMTLGTTAQASADPREGGEVLVVMSFEDGGTVAHTGSFRVFDPPGRLVMSWNSALVEDSEVSVTLTAQERMHPSAPPSTVLELVHSGVPERWHDWHYGGWNHMLDGLARALARGG